MGTSSGVSGFMPDPPGETDLLSNATRIVPHPDEDPRPWLGAVASGNGQLLTFIHEATHNWCFSSALVHAQLHLAARAQINSNAFVAMSDGDGDMNVEPDSPTKTLSLFAEFMHALGMDPRSRLGDRSQATVLDELSLAVHDDVIRLEVIGALLRPLAEGLALFAEYDAVSRASSKAWSPMPRAVVWNFAGFERMKRARWVEPFSTMLLAGQLIEGARLTPQAVEAKASVLAQPLTSTSGGYLPGYLAVKNMWRHLYRQDPRLYGESDLVLSYIRSFFFESVPLAATLLAPPQPNSITSTKTIINAFMKRMDDFGRVSPDDVAAFEDHIAGLSGDERERGFTPGMLYSEEEEQGARERVALAQEAYQRTSTAARLFEEAVFITNSQLNDIWRQRPFLITCSVPVVLEPAAGNGGIVIRWQGEQVLSVPPEDVLVTQTSVTRHGTTSLDAEPRLDVLLGTFGSATLSRAVVTSRGEQVVSCTVWGPESTSQSMRQQVLSGFASRDNRVMAGRAFQALPNLIVDGDWGLRMNRDHVRNNLSPAVDSLYRDTALWHARDYAAVNRCADLMARDGMYGLLGSTGALRRVALLGLAASLNSTYRAVEELFSERDYDLADTLRQLDACWDRHGFPPRPSKTQNKDALLVPLI